MIVTVTLNTGIDRTLLVPTFAWDTTIRARQVVYGMGGKAVGASWVLGELGVENLALGFAAGASGRHLQRLLQQKGVQSRFTWAGGETRTNTILVSAAGEGQTTITANSLEVQPHHIQQFIADYSQALSQASCVVIGGTLPPGVEPEIYAQLVSLAVSQKIPVVFDASGQEILQAGLSARPTLIKPNQVELAEIIQAPLDSLEDIYQAGCQVQRQFGCSVVTTLGKRGALAVAQAEAYFIEPPAVEVQSAAGAGDAIVAGLARGLALNWPIIDGLRLGFAAAAAVLMTLPTADCRRADVERLMPLVRIRKYKG